MFNTQQWALLFTLVATTLSAGRILIINPILKSIAALENAISELSERLRKTETTLASMGEKVKTAHRRINDLTQRFDGMRH